MAQNFNLTQTGEEVQTLLDQVTPNSRDIQQLQQEVTSFLNTQQVQDLIASALTGYSTTEEVTAAIQSALTTALASYSTTSQMNSAINAAIAQALTAYSTTEQVTAAIGAAITTALSLYYSKTEVDALIANFITRSVSDLVNYYLKSDTYSRLEVQQLIDTVKQFVYVSAAELPTASADTMNKIYLIPSANPQQQNVKDEFITIATTEQGLTTYAWEQIGSTTIDLSGYYTSAQTDAAITTALNTALAAYSTTSQMNSAIAAALAAYYTKTEIDLLLAGKQPTISDLADIRSGAQKGAISAPQNTTYTKQEVDALIANFITRSVSDLVNYYLKSDLYTKAEVQQLIDAVKQFRYQLAAELPTASQSTMGIIYLVPSPNPQQANAKDEYITIEVQSGGQTTYQWEQIGTTTIDLSGYYTSAQTDAAITAALNTALANYATSAQMTDAVNRIAFVERGLGKYDTVRTVTLAQATAGKYVNVNGQEVSASGYGISEEVQLNAGDILLVPSASAVPADVSLFARIVTRTYQKVITYAYTYRVDYPELPLTATADYNPALIYTAQYNETGETPVLTGWLMGGQTYATLPATREVTESYYEPLMKQAVSAMPSTGYYVYLCPTGMTIVVSGYTATVSGGVAHVVGLGIFKNIATNFIGAPGQAVLAQAIAQLVGEIEGMKAQLENLGETRAVCINSEEVPQVQNVPMIVTGSGAPSAPNVPAFVGQKYLDLTNKKEYTAFSVTNSISDWVLIN